MKRMNLMEAQKKGTPAAKVRAREAFNVMRSAVPARKRPRRESPDNPVVKCPVCGRVTQADMFLEVSDLDPSITGGADFACDGCTSRWRREGRMD